MAKTKNSIRAAAEAAAEYWAQFIGGRVGSRNYGADGMAAVIPYLAQPAVGEQSESTVEKFKRVFVAKVERNAGIGSKDGKTPLVIVSTDYGPEWFLLDCLQEAGVKSAGSFPWKTQQVITPTCVTVAEGYHAREKAIFGERECRTCKPYVRSEKGVDSGGWPHSVHVYGEPTGKKLDWESNNDRTRYEITDDRRFTQPLGAHTVTDDPCPTCGGAKVLRAPSAAAAA